MNLDWADKAPTRKQFLLGGGHLAAIWAITFVQPLLDVLGKNPDFFVARGNTPGDILILAIGFTLVPPLVLLAIEWFARLIGPKVYYAVHFLFFWGIATFLFIQILSNFFEKPTILLVLMALVIGGLLTYWVFTVTFVKNLMDILIIAPVVILLLFVFASKSSEAIFPKSDKIDIGATVNSKTPVVMVIFDELGTSTLMTKDESLDGQRFPNFKELGKEATWYKNETTTSYFTPTAVPGILTGNRPDSDQLATAADQPDNIFSLLAGSYKFHVEEPITQICAAELCPVEDTLNQNGRLKSLYEDLKIVEGRLVLPPRIAATLPDVGTNFGDFGAGGGKEKKGSIDDQFVKGRGGAETPAYYSNFIKRIPTGDSNMTMLHMKVPHQPWKYDIDGVQYNSSPIDQLSDSTNTWFVDDAGVASAQQRQIVQTGYADHLLGQIMDRLKKAGTWDKTMVVVMADHGVDFQGGDVPQRMAGTESMGEVANPPLFIKYPGQKQGKVDPIHSMTLDVVPTIAQELNVDGMYETDGVPLQSDSVPVRDVTVKDVKNNDFTQSIEDVIKQRTTAIAEKDRRFGTGPFYTLGPVPDLIGKPAPPIASGSATEAQLDRPQIWENYVPGKGLIPIFVNGTLDGPDPGTTIAVGVNGKIQGTTRSFDFEDKQRFGTLVDPKSLVPGRNEITVYSVGPRNKLSPLGSN